MYICRFTHSIILHKYTHTTRAITPRDIIYFKALRQHKMRMFNFAPVKKRHKVKKSDRHSVRTHQWRHNWPGCQQSQEARVESVSMANLRTAIHTTNRADAHYTETAASKRAKVIQTLPPLTKQPTYRPIDDPPLQPVTSTAADCTTYNQTNLQASISGCCALWLRIRSVTTIRWVFPSRCWCVPNTVTVFFFRKWIMTSVTY